MRCTGSIPATGVAFIDGVIGILREAGFSDGDAARYFREIGYYLTGAALDETAGYAKGPSAAEPVSDAMIAADFRHLAAAAPYFQPAHFQATFETGLEILLEGIRRARQGAAVGLAGDVIHLLNGPEGMLYNSV